MIDAALEEAVQASREGRPFGVLEHMAGNFQFNGQAAGDRSDIIRYVRTLKPDVKIQDRRLTLDGDSATWTTPVKIVFGDSESGVGGTFEIPDVKIHFRRSFGTRMTFFPYSSWKMERVDAPNFLPPMLPF
ncbi:MAG: hypothetical protein MH204_03030 [Fimbriimonadaceae bacterium]|nr:hypothetical protein [Fimbriimonadaceae bacterium]